MSNDQVLAHVMHKVFMLAASRAERLSEIGLHINSHIAGAIHGMCEERAIPASLVTIKCKHLPAPGQSRPSDKPFERWHLLAGGKVFSVIQDPRLRTEKHLVAGVWNSVDALVGDLRRTVVPLNIDLSSPYPYAGHVSIKEVCASLELGTLMDMALAEYQCNMIHRQVVAPLGPSRSPTRRL